MPQLTIFDGQEKVYCLLNSRSNHIHVKIVWNTQQNRSKYRYDSAWKMIIGEKCNNEKYPFNKTKKFIQFIKSELELDPDPKKDIGPVESQEC